MKVKIATKVNARRIANTIRGEFTNFIQNFARKLCRKETIKRVLEGAKAVLNRRACDWCFAIALLQNIHEISTGRGE